MQIKGELRCRLQPSTYWLLASALRRYKAVRLPRSGRWGPISGASDTSARDLRRLLASKGVGAIAHSKLSSAYTVPPSLKSSMFSIGTSASKIPKIGGEEIAP